MNKDKKFLAVLEPLKFGDYRLLVIGQMISTLGDSFYLMALPWLIFNNNRDASSLGYISMFFGITSILGIVIGGLFTDKFGPCKLMIISDVSRTILLGLMTLVGASGNFSFAALCIVVSFFGLFTGVFRPAYFSITPNILLYFQLKTYKGEMH